ncbi:MAG: DUF6252 family protein [Gemmatimonadota bacterium]
MRLPVSTISLPALAFTLACGGGGGNGGPGGPGGGGGNANFTASIDGTSWTAITAATQVLGSANGTFVIVGSTGGSNPTALSLSLVNISGPGTYSLGVAAVVPGGLATITTGTAGWSTPLSGLAGTVTITAVSATRIAGTFSFVATPVLSASGNRNVTQGSFDLPVTSSGSVAVAPNRGSRIAGTLNGSPWNAATIVMVAAPASGVLTIGTGTNTHLFNVIISGYTGVGTYTLGTGVTRQVTLALLGTSQGWGGPGANSGTVTVTSANADRIQGTLNVTLQPAAGTQGVVTFTAAFDLGLAQ